MKQNLLWVCNVFNLFKSNRNYLFEAKKNFLLCNLNVYSVNEKMRQILRAIAKQNKKTCETEEQLTFQEKHNTMAAERSRL